jgi:hypothetical protein
MAFRKLGMSTLGMAVALPLAMHAGVATLHAKATGTKVTAKLKTGTTLVLTGTIDDIGITVNCTSFSASGTAPATGSINVTLPAPPKISGCTDSIFGTDTVATNQKDGKWTLKETTSGTKKTLTLTMPKAGATFTSSIVNGCIVTASPTGTTAMAGAFVSTGKDKGTDTVKNADVPVSATGCTAASPSTLSATVVLAPVA